MDGKWRDCKMAMPPGSAPPAGKGGKGAVEPTNPKIFVGALPTTATQDAGGRRTCPVRVGGGGDLAGCWWWLESHSGRGWKRWNLGW